MSDNKKNVANEIVMIFRKLKIALISGVIWFFGFSLWNELIFYTFFFDITKEDSLPAWKAEEILGYVPSEYTFIERGRYNFSSSYGDLVITEGGLKSVKGDIVDQLLEESLLSTLMIILIVFGIILVYTYIARSFKWVQKYSD